MAAIPSMPGLPPLSFTGGSAGPSSAGSNAGVNLPINLPVNLDHSGWNVVMHGNATQSATGNTDANGIAGTGLLDSLIGSKNLPLLAAGGLVLLLLVRR
ncbi:hypothetical protein [Pseudoduganella aquatica]|uniref:hypothetical protein n=1 Tax=Pseudoduganella aquatica TaxID=2660641 RepID=UPI001E3E84D2|nr:hypothetical protein [Pseudoduganella aquatica]